MMMMKMKIMITVLESTKLKMLQKKPKKRRL
jgi:hypothetical protein